MGTAVPALTLVWSRAPWRWVVQGAATASDSMVQWTCSDPCSCGDSLAPVLTASRQDCRTFEQACAAMRAAQCGCADFVLRLLVLCCLIIYLKASRVCLTVSRNDLRCLRCFLMIMVMHAMQVFNQIGKIHRRRHPALVPQVAESCTAMRRAGCFHLNHVHIQPPASQWCHQHMESIKPRPNVKRVARH